MISVTRIAELPAEFDLLVDASLREGFRFLRRLDEEWKSGVNRFAAPDEALFCAWHKRRLVGVCGLNRDPYCADPAVGRVRHLYVDPGYRRRGIGRELVRHVISAARERFRILRLRTDTAEGDLFYGALGFTPTPQARDATHEMPLPQA